LLEAVATPEGALALVVGAGTSMEAPTSLPSARKCSVDAHTQLRRNGVIDEGECEDPGDLAALTSLVFNKTGAQKALVKQLPLDHFKAPTPNAGHKALVALMAERAISHVLSLNFDLAVQAAASELGIRTIKFISNPGDLIPASPTLVHLHRNAYADPEDLVLRVESLTHEWRESWEQVVAQHILAAPNVLFIGLGSPAPVLTETVQMIAEAVGGGKAFYQADIAPYEGNVFAESLGIAADHFVQAGWCAVMVGLSARLAEEQVDALIAAGRAVLAVNGAEGPSIDRFEALANRLRGKSLLTLGLMRSQCKLRPARYLPQGDFNNDLWAEPMQEIASVCAEHELTAEPAANGLWKVLKEDRRIASILIATGSGANRVTALEPSIRSLCTTISETSLEGPDIVLVGGVLPYVGETSPPTDIISGEPTEDLIGGPGQPEILVVSDAVLSAHMGALLDA
jgi:hypothetical protein